MILRLLQLKNFLSHKDTVLRFTPEQKLLVDGVSGSGKSSICEAVIWVFYGKGRMDNRSLIKNGERFAEVRIELDTAAGPFIVQRRIDVEGKHTILLLGPNGLPVQVSGLKATQEYIEHELLRSSYELFINSIVYPQENPDSFVRQSASKRKDLILEIAKASYFDEYYDKAKDKLSDLALGCVKLEAEINSLQAQMRPDEGLISAGVDAEIELPELQKTVGELSVLAKTQESARLNLSALEAEVKSLDSQFHITSNLLLEKNSARDILQHKLDTWTPANITVPTAIGGKTRAVLEAELNTTNTQLDALYAWKNKHLEISKVLRPISRAFDDELAEINAQIIKEQSVKFELCPGRKLPCPTLTRGRDARVAELEERLVQKTADRIKYVEDLTAYNEKIEALGPMPIVAGRTRIEIETDLKMVLEEERTLALVKATEQTTLATMQATLASLKNEVDRLKEENITRLAHREELQKEITPYKDYLANTIFDEDLYNSTQKRVAELEAIVHLAQGATLRHEANTEKLVTATTGKQETEAHIDSLTLLKSAFGPNGIKAVVIDYIIPRLEDRINSILSKLSDFRVRLDTQKANVTGEKTLEGLFITIYNSEGDSYDFEGYSGGEKLRIIVAISEALAEIQNAKFRILDEVFVGLDEESIEKFSETMMTLQERFSQLVCVSHLKSIKDMFNEKVTVVKTNGTSRVL